MTRELFLSLMCSLFIHLTVAHTFSHSIKSEAQAVVQKGRSTVNLSLQPSLQSKSKREEKIIQDLNKRSSQELFEEEEKLTPQLEKQKVVKEIKDVAIKSKEVLHYVLSVVNKAEIVEEEVQVGDVVPRDQEDDKRIVEDKKIEEVLEEVIESVSSPLEVDSKPKGVTAPANLSNKIKPVYPKISKRRGEQGSVSYLVEVLSTGESGAIEMIHSSGYRRLDDSARQALKKANYIPALQDGVMVSSKKIFTIRFEIKDHDS